MVPPILCQAMRVPEQLLAREETKAQATIFRTHRAAISNNSRGTVALQACAILQLGNWRTKDSNLPQSKTASVLVKGQREVLRIS